MPTLWRCREHFHSCKALGTAASSSVAGLQMMKYPLLETRKPEQMRATALNLLSLLCPVSLSLATWTSFCHFLSLYIQSQDFRAGRSIQTHTNTNELHKSFAHGSFRALITLKWNSLQQQHNDARRWRLPLHILQLQQYLFDWLQEHQISSHWWHGKMEIRQNEEHIIIWRDDMKRW